MNAWPMFTEASLQQKIVGRFSAEEGGAWIGKNVYTVTIPDGNFFYAAALMKIV